MKYPKAKNAPAKPKSYGATVDDPELVFGLVGPIGVDLDEVVGQLTASLEDVGYRCEQIHITELMKHRKVKGKVDQSSYFNRYKSLIDYANDYRRVAGHPAALAGRSILHIRKLREAAGNSFDNPVRGSAYIIRQFKRPEEIELMRRVYGRKFIQISVYGSPEERRRILIDKIKKFDPSPKKDSVCEEEALKLIDLDHNQKNNDNGQRISDVFHLGDVFVNGIDKKTLSSTIERFVAALFGHNGVSPTKDEYGLYIATAASLRSIDLSRQVGAAIFTSNGEVVSMGCNEVPKAGGGTYWTDGDQQPFRDFEVGADTNHDRKTEILFEFSSILAKERLLSTTINRLSQTEVFKVISANERVKSSQLMDIIEFGRMIHAEMSAISDAARLGRAVAGCTLYCTTFPCHLCAKHIVAAGVKRVVFLEPYPKSYANRLHADSITFSPSEQNKVLFQPFMGISPRRYRDIFEKKRRKDADTGVAQEWYHGKPVPMIEDRSSAYLANEDPAVLVSLKGIHS